jgi:hypothetical protein
LYYFELVLPVLALAVLAMSRDAFRPAWANAWPKVAVVAVLAIVLNAGFLRSPLLARLADPTVPHAILIAWLAAALPAMFRLPNSWRPWCQRWRRPLAAGMTIAAAPLAFVLAVTVIDDFDDRVTNAALTEGPARALGAAASTVRGVRRDWELANWTDRRHRPGAITLAMYLNTCTPPGARIFVQPYIPQVPALGRRAFAGGHADLRAGFFNSEEAQALTVARLQRQEVPIALLGEPVDAFERSFPVVGAYLRRNYDAVGSRAFDDRLTINLLVKKDLPAVRSYAELEWPCPA